MELVIHGAMGCGEKGFKLVWKFHQLMFGFLVNGQLLRVSRQSIFPANYKDDNEKIPRAVQRSGIFITTEENPGKRQLGNIDEDCATSKIHSNGYYSYYP